METRRAKFLIVGGGIAGLALAERLSRAKQNCIVLEAGSSKPVGDWRKLSWYDPAWDEMDIVSSREYRSDLLRVKALGGSAEAWEGYIPRWNRADFQQYLAFGVGVDWPFGYEDLETYYCRAERLLGAAGEDGNRKDGPRSEPYPLPAFAWTDYEREVASRTRSEGLEWHAYPQARNSMPYGRRSHCNEVGTCNFCPIHARWTPRAGLLPALNRSKYVDIVTSAVCSEVRVDAEGNPAAVVARRKQGSTVGIEFETMILAAGAIECSRLLLLTRKAQARRDGFWSNQQIGLGYMDHPIFRVAADVGWDPGHSRQTNILSTSHSYRDYDPSSGAWGFTINLNRRILPKLWLAAHFEMPAVPENRVQLSSGKVDFCGNPVAAVHVDVNYDGYGATKERILSTLEDAARAAGGSNLLKNPLQLWACHPMGGCAISSECEQGVVDSDLKVWGAKNLYVLSNGVFASSASVNPTLTLLALCLRLADHLTRNGEER